MIQVITCSRPRQVESLFLLPLPRTQCCLMLFLNNKVSNSLFTGDEEAYKMNTNKIKEREREHISPVVSDDQ